MAATGTASTAQQRRAFCWFSTGPVLQRVALALVLVHFHLIAAQQLQPSADETRQDDHNGTCKSMDIRNTLDAFKRLEGCRVVEGFVQILLFDNVNETELAKITFPDLVEITDYLLLYRVNGLRTLGKLFPNLTVIRGQNTFFQYSLVIFEMFSLQEIGLYSLTDITRGLIRIDKNPSLCFVHSIDWELIAHDKGDHFIKSLKPPNECPVCPGKEEVDEDLRSGGGKGLVACPKAPIKSDIGSNSGRDKYLCWNRQHCQKICSNPKCRYCNIKGECCSDSCIGGCSDNNVKSCNVCKNLTMGSNDDRQCMSNCPTNFYQYLERRCVSHEQCMMMPRPIDLHSRNEDEFPYKIFNGKCILHCPTDYMNDLSNKKNRTCKPCEGNCKKDCHSVNIDSINLARQLRGCTNITGSLEIQLRGGKNVVNELEDNLGMIEEITGYLKIVRSFPLVSLNFLKNLKRIRGSQLESQKYALVVLDNQNLLDLWDWREGNRTFHIDRGRLFFHFNPKLCINKIDELQKAANLSKYTDLEVAPNSNGDKIACDLAELKVEITTWNSKGVVLQWKRFQMLDQRQLLGYIVFFIETKDKNVTWYDGRDACGGDGWRVDDVRPPPDLESQYVSHPLLTLKPYTQYAYYVKTYTIATEQKGAQSKIDYFRTLSSEPSSPTNLNIINSSYSSFNISWGPPDHPNGNITYYIVSGRRHAINALDESSEREHCNYSPTPKQPPPSYRPPETPKSSETCDCEDAKTSSKSLIDEGEESSRIVFENYLQNEVYIRRNVNRRKRELASEAFPNDPPKAKDNNQIDVKNNTDNITGTWESFKFNVTGKTHFFINNLHHASEYEIFVQACRELEGANDANDSCSGTTMISRRTEIKKGADEIRDIDVQNNSSEMVSITWKEPDDPNGIIYGYTIEYKRLDNENSNTACITHSTFLKKNRVYTLGNLLPGNYSLRVKALTYDIGNKDYSKEVYFYIEASSSPNTVLIVTISLVLASALFLFLYVCYKKQKSDRESMRLIPSVNPEYVPSVYVADEWEVPRKKIELIKELGQGSFGMVYEGLARDLKGHVSIRCAVKTVNEHATHRERWEFLNEASVMKAFDTAHVVRLLGVVSEGQPTLVIMELMANGDLKSYLRSHRPDEDNYDPSTMRNPPTLKQILQMAIEIADGMAYLAAKKFVHRDLAARNCMVAEDLTVKIGDFGMTRDIYETDYYRKGTKGLLPVRWMAPESLKDGVFTSNSDVWSYGVVLWEMATLASQPYQGLSNDQVLRYVIDGGVMERPENCPDKLYGLMRMCWQHKPSARPGFLKLCSLLYDDANTTFKQISFYDSAAGQEARASRPTPSASQDDPTTPLRITEDLDNNFSMNSDDSDTDDYRDDMEPALSFNAEGKDGRTTANGYVSGCPTNGAATTQC